MVTYSELFLLLTLIVSIITLVYNTTKKNNRPATKRAVYFFKLTFWANRLYGLPYPPIL